jgi:hypothetical protein
MHALFWLEKLKERDHFEALGMNGKIILECILGWDVVNWMHLA